ncbi:hypothetical protein [Bosea sp. BH3]|uniref:hypothetical protein n=1 Tax=Bosea sp. BH3 TaxID=2871701 RepID=UPI0021CB1708|nr:hypothetical protein [Bosea sp. BH3]MCU4180181.1 hypothetical protein [Bosea sp. BH3]
MDKNIMGQIRAAVLRGDRKATLAALRELGRGKDPHDSDDASASEGVNVTLSLAELMALIELVTKPKSFGEALAEIGFEPVKGARLAPREPHPMRRGPLPRRSEDDQT